MNDEAEVGVSAGKFSIGLSYMRMRNTHHAALTLHSRTDSHSACKSSWKPVSSAPEAHRSQATHNSEQLHVVEPHAWATGTERSMVKEVDW